MNRSINEQGKVPEVFYEMAKRTLAEEASEKTAWRRVQPHLHWILFGIAMICGIWFILDLLSQ